MPTHFSTAGQINNGEGSGIFSGASRDQSLWHKSATPSDQGAPSIFNDGITNFCAGGDAGQDGGIGLLRMGVHRW